MKYIFSSLLLLAAANVFAQKALTPGQKLNEQIKDNEKNTYTVSMQNGGFFSCSVIQRGRDLAIDLVSPSGKPIKTFDSPNGANGNEPIVFDALEKGNYKLVVYDLESAEQMGNKRGPERPGNYLITDITILTEKEYSAKKDKDQKQLQAGIGWIEKNAHPLKTTAPGTGFQDLQWMKPVLQDVKYVGLGEATHGTHDFFQLKHRMLEFLVKELGYNTFAIEASYAGCQNINDYVLNGKGDARTALASQGFWTWNTQEVLDLIEWIRTYNTTTKPDKKVSFIGFDIQYNTQGGGTDRIRNYLKKASPSMAQQHDTFFTHFAAAEKKQMRDSTAMNVRKAFQQLKRAVLTNRDSLIARSSRSEYENMMEYMNIVSEYLSAYVYRNGVPTKQQMELRDRYMAGNIKRYAQANRDAKIVIWAHNSHINKNPDFEVNGGPNPMGSLLRASLGNTYYAMGFLFNKGSFSAMDNGDTTGKMVLKQFTAKPAKDGSLEAIMKKAASGSYIVDFRGVEDKKAGTKEAAGSKKERKSNLPEDVQAFTETEFKSRMFGATASEDFVDENYVTPVTIAKDFDAIVFIENTTAAKPIKAK